MVVDLTCSPEVIGIIRYLETMTTDFRVTSTFRPGAITAAGNPSRHGRKLAVDFAAPTAGRDTQALAVLFACFTPIEGHLNELIYAGPQVTYNIKKGERVAKYAQSVHHDHVHVAVDPGLDLHGLAKQAAPEDPKPINPTDGREDMADPVDAIVAPQGGVWVLTRDGGVRTYDKEDRTPFHGSYPGLPPEARQGERTFVRLEANDRGGYDLISSGNERYSFP